VPYKDPARAKENRKRRYQERRKDPDFIKACIERSRNFANTSHGKRSNTNSYLKYKFGITIEQREQMFKAQNGLCAICNKPFGIKFHIDHNHATGKVRQVLCSKCNMALGLFNDDSNIIKNAMEYLNKWQ
jgi:hypothetical protein